MPKFRFSLKVTVICGLLALAMLRASYWQFQRHTAKKSYIAEMQARLEIPIEPLAEILRNDAINFDNLPYRRVSIKGTFDFEHEMVLRNRRYNDAAGVFVLTPLKLENTDAYIIVSRGFIPLSKAAKELRKEYQINSNADFIALLKESSRVKFLAPKDPESGPNKPWVDAWLRVDLLGIGKQLPYKILPVYAEIMETQDSKLAQEKIVNVKSKRDEMLFMPSVSGSTTQNLLVDSSLNYPIPVFDTVIPAGRHFGYIFEWAIMAVITILIGLVLQLRRLGR